MITGELKSQVAALTEAPFADVAPQGPEVIFEREDLDRLFEAVEQVTQRAEG